MFLKDMDRVVLTKEGADYLINQFCKLPVREGYNGVILMNGKYDYVVSLLGLGTYHLEEKHIRRDGTLDRYRVEFTLNGELCKEDITATDSSYALLSITDKYSINGNVNVLGVHLVSIGV